jgi:hypothetical protein
MNTLILDIDNEAGVKKVKELSKYDTVIIGTIRRPKLFPIPDVIVVNFDFILETKRREEILVELAAKLHPQVLIISCADEWQKGKVDLAKAFGVDHCVKFSDIDNLPVLLFACTKAIFPTLYFS